VGVKDALIGLTVVSAGTSLPELAISIAAAFKKEPDIAVGNIVGSNIFNVLGIFGISAIFSPLETQGISPSDIYAMIGLSVVLIPFIRSGFVLNRVEAALLVGLYGIYLYQLWP